MILWGVEIDERLYFSEDIIIVSYSLINGSINLQA
jgi:hypothetical protein